MSGDFTPTKNGQSSAMIGIDSNISVNGPNVVAIPLVGSTPQQGSDVEANALSFEFGDVAPGATSPSQAITISNYSASPGYVQGDIAGVAGTAANLAPNEFAVSPGTCSENVNIPPGGTCQMSGDFTPTSTSPANQIVMLAVGIGGVFPLGHAKIGKGQKLREPRPHINPVAPSFDVIPLVLHGSDGGHFVPPPPPPPPPPPSGPACATPFGLSVVSGGNQSVQPGTDFGSVSVQVSCGPGSTQQYATGVAVTATAPSATDRNGSPQASGTMNGSAVGTALTGTDGIATFTSIVADATVCQWTLSIASTGVTQSLSVQMNNGYEACPNTSTLTSSVVSGGRQVTGTIERAGTGGMPVTSPDPMVLAVTCNGAPAAYYQVQWWIAQLVLTTGGGTSTNGSTEGQASPGSACPKSLAVPAGETCSLIGGAPAETACPQGSACSDTNTGLCPAPVVTQGMDTSTADVRLVSCGSANELGVGMLDYCGLITTQTVGSPSGCWQLASDATEVTDANGEVAMPQPVLGAADGTWTIVATSGPYVYNGSNIGWTGGAAPYSTFAITQSSTLAATGSATSTCENPIVILSTPPESAAAGKAFPDAASVIVDCPDGYSDTGAQVTFTATGTGPSGTFAGGQRSVTVTVGPDGIAQAPPLTATGPPGPWPLQVSWGPSSSEELNMTMVNAGS